MSYTVKVADLEKDKPTIVAILERNRTRTDTDYSKRFDWIYLNNPFGKAKAWIIYNDKTGDAIGFTGVFPRPVFVEGKEYLAWNCGDFSIDQKYRTLGVALKLRREAKKGVDSGEVALLYAHPNKRMEVIHFRVGHQKISEMRRFALPLKFDRYFRQKISSNALAATLALPLNFGMKLKFALKRSAKLAGKIKAQIECSDQHEQLFEQMKAQFKVIGVRNCQYLKWKFADHPNFKYQQFDCFENNRLKGTIFFTIKEETVHIIDVLIPNYREMLVPLFLEFIKQVYKTKSGQTLSFILQKDNPIIPLLKSIGFKERDDATSSVIAYANESMNEKLAKTILQGSNWYMTVGDRDA
ncbi:hypothetical protein [Caldithrix abyssi]